MLITVEEMKKYLRVDSADDDALIRQLMEASEKMVADVSRRNAGELDEISEVAKTAELYAAAYLYEHREEADHGDLTGTLKNLLSTVRKEAF